MKKNYSLSFMCLVRFQAYKMCFFGKFTAGLVLKSLSGRNKSLEAHVFGFSDSLPYDLEESRDLRALISWVLSWQAFKNAKKYLQFFFVFLSCHYGFTNYFYILIFFLISYQEEFQTVQYYISRISTSRNIKLKKLENSVS